MTVAISCLEEEVDIRMQSLLRSHAAAAGDLVALFCEDSLTDPSFKGTKGHVDPRLLEASRAARTSANRLLSGEAATDGDTVKALSPK